VGGVSSSERAGGPQKNWGPMKEGDKKSGKTKRSDTRQKEGQISLNEQ